MQKREKQSMGRPAIVSFRIKIFEMRFHFILDNTNNYWSANCHISSSHNREQVAFQELKYL